jgi:hypothetical protein
MKCPHCDYPNPVGATHCQLCQEVFNKSAADRYLHAQRRYLRDQGHKPQPQPEPAEVDFTPVTRILKERVKINWGAHWARVRDWLQRMIVAYPKELAVAGGIILIGFAVLFFTSPAQRLVIFGRRMEYRFPANVPAGYLVGIHSEIKRWSERDQRLDTPLGIQAGEEIGNVKIMPAKRQRRLQKLVLQAREWITTQRGSLPQTIPTTHASLKPSTITLDRRGRIQDRTRGSFRIGRLTPFILPMWPSKNLRTGAEWDEPVEWISAYGDWKIYWRGRLHWRLDGTTSVGGSIGLQLTYDARIAPSLWEAPSWAVGQVRRLNFTGTHRGQAVFNTRTHQLDRNDFTQDGALTFTISDLYRIPRDVRVGRTPRYRHGSSRSQPGVLIFQIKDTIDIRKS